MASPVDRFYDYSLLGLLASGYLAVLGSGYLDAPTAVATAVALTLRGVLIAGNAMDWDGATKMCNISITEMCVARRDLRQQRTRHAVERTHLIAPRALADVEQQRARGVRDVAAVRASLRQPPNQKRLDCAEREFALLGARAQCRVAIENPSDLGG